MTEPFAYRNPDGSIRLDEALGERCARHYVGILTSSSEEFAAMQLAAAQTVAPEDQGAAWPPWHGQPSGPVVDGLVLQPQGSGPDTCSPSVSLALLPEIVWDVCGYYRALGFHWSQFRQVTPRAIRIRYLELDPRQEDGELFYAAAQLLDPVIRRAYDCQPLGGLFLGDRNVRALMERHAALEASRRNAHDRLHYGQHGYVETTQDEVLKEWGFEKGGVTAEAARERLRHPGESQPLTGESLGSTLNAWDRHWTYYRLVDPGDPTAAAVAGVDVVEAWQALLCAAFSANGITEQFSVGTWPGHQWKMWRDSNKRCIFFVGEEPPTQSMATEAARGYLAQITVTVRKAQACPS